MQSNLSKELEDNANKFDFEDTKQIEEWGNSLDMEKLISPVTDEDFLRELYIESVLNYWATRDKFFKTRKFVQGSYYTDCPDEYEPSENEIYLNVSTEDLEYLYDVKDMICARQVCGYDYIVHGEDEIYLFCDEYEALLYFNWS
jgi:hypothetical protein